jgi:hypothetical protein
MPALKGRNRTRWAFVPPFQGFAYLWNPNPGASLTAHAASLCPRLICSAPSGQCPSRHVNRGAPREIRSRTRCRMNPTSARSVAGTNGATNIPPKAPSSFGLQVNGYNCPNAARSIRLSAGPIRLLLAQGVSVKHSALRRQVRRNATYAAEIWLQKTDHLRGANQLGYRLRVLFGRHHAPPQK